MIYRSADPAKSKGWYLVPSDSGVPVPVGYASQGIQDVGAAHYHAQMYEIYLVARGESVALVNDKRVTLKVGDMLAVAPGETHHFLTCSADYFHFVVQAPFVPGDKYNVKSA
jgi:mannose-6-phosphate isomerase-like protein (cupin superfamily)